MKAPSLIRVLLASFAAVVLAAVSGCGGESSADGPVTIRVGYLKVIQWTHLADIAEHVDSDKVNIELMEFKTSNEVLVALSSGSIDVGDIGYNHLASALERGQTNLEFIAGLSSKGSALIQRPDAGISTWDDLTGMRIGGSRGSTQYMQLAAGMKEAGMDIESDVDFVNLSSSTDMNVALRNGDVDAVMQWEPGAATAIVEGYGQPVPGVAETLYGDTFEASSGVAARKDFVEDNPDAVQAFIDGFWKSYNAVTSDRDHWIDTFAELVEVDREVLELSTENAQPDFGMDQTDIASMMSVLEESGATKKDMFDELSEHLNYTFIAEASGRTPQELGAQ